MVKSKLNHRLLLDIYGLYKTSYFPLQGVETSSSRRINKRFILRDRGRWKIYNHRVIILRKWSIVGERKEDGEQQQVFFFRSSAS